MPMKSYLNTYLKQYNKVYEQLVFDRQEYSKLHNTVEWGNWIYECIKNNDIDEIINAVSSVEKKYTPGTLSSNELQSKKYLSIGLIFVIVNWAAHDRIIDNETILTVADVCILLCDESKSKDELVKNTYSALIIISNLIAEYKEKEYNPIVQYAKDYIYKNLHFRIHVTDIADSIGVSPEHLSRTFHHVEGISIKEYILEERINRARNLLKHSDYEISEIAEYLAFSSASHFASVFKKHTKKTPTEYRKDYFEINV